jgi:hypothetical protein
VLLLCQLLVSQQGSGLTHQLAQEGHRRGGRGLLLAQAAVVGLDTQVLQRSDVYRSRSCRGEGRGC